jgi:hypothetical protein
MHTIGLRVTLQEAEKFAEREGVGTKEYLAGLLEDGGTYIIP